MAPCSVAIPLYIYPEVHNWDALFEVIATFSHAHFNIVINPFNGPGGTVPDANYIRDVARLNKHKNVTIFGYVHVSWGNRDLKLVSKDVLDWARWREYRPADIHVSGVFVDEAPSEHDKVNYMRSVYEDVKHELGQHALVWTNPGVEIEEAFYAYADLVNAHENTHAAWSQHQHKQAHKKDTTMIHSYSGTSSELVRDVDALRHQGYSSILITTETCYTTFSKQLTNLVQRLC